MLDARSAKIERGDLYSDGVDAVKERKRKARREDKEPTVEGKRKIFWTVYRYAAAVAINIAGKVDEKSERERERERECERVGGSATKALSLAFTMKRRKDTPSSSGVVPPSPPPPPGSPDPGGLPPPFDLPPSVVSFPCGSRCTPLV